MQADQTPAPRRSIKSLIVSLLCLTGLGYWGWDYYQTSLQYEETDNAYLGANVLQVSSRIPGVLEQLAVTNNHTVQQGDLLFALDREPYQRVMDEFEAKLKQAAQTVGVNLAGVAAARSKLDEKKVQVNNARATLTRLQSLSSKQFMSAQSLDDAKTALAAAEAAVRQAEAELNQAMQKVKSTEAQNPDIQEQLAKLEQAKLNLKYTQAYAPVSGRIANLTSRPGSYVNPGQPLFSLIDEGYWWVDANFKETQVLNIRPGKKARIHIDLCPQVEFEGEVESIAGGTGASFSLLPAQNANSNWVKVTQRIPVRIKLLTRQADCPLIIGSSATVRVAIR